MSWLLSFVHVVTFIWSRCHLPWVTLSPTFIQVVTFPPLTFLIPSFTHIFITFLHSHFYLTLGHVVTRHLFKLSPSFTHIFNTFLQSHCHFSSVYIVTFLQFMLSPSFGHVVTFLRSHCHLPSVTVVTFLRSQLLPSFGHFSSPSFSQKLVVTFHCKNVNHFSPESQIRSHSPPRYRIDWPQGPIWVMLIRPPGPFYSLYFRSVFSICRFYLATIMVWQTNWGQAATNLGQIVANLIWVRL